MENDTKSAVDSAKSESKEQAKSEVKADNPEPKTSDAPKTEAKAPEGEKADGQPKNESETPAAKESKQAFETSYELEAKRLEDAGKGAKEEDQVKDEDAVKTDGTANVNADKSLPTTEAQVQSVENVKPEDAGKEPAKLEKTLEEQLGIKNPDDRLAEELRKAKVEPNDKFVPSAGSEAKKSEGDVDERTDDITFPDGAQKAQDRKDAKAGFDFHIQEAEKKLAELKRLAPKN